MTDESFPVICGNCKSPLGPDNRQPGGPPCPKCGATSRCFGVVREAAITQTPYAAGVARDESTEKAFFESERLDGGSASGGLSETGASFGSRGKPTRGEDETLSTCQRLIRVLNTKGKTLGEPSFGEDHVDCVSRDEVTGKIIQFQVVRAIIDPHYWKRLFKENATERSVSLADAADLLWGAIQHKAKLPLAQRAELVLVLDANRAPSIAFQKVVDDFRERYGSLAKALGFLAIYVVGPDDALVKSLA